MTTTKTLNIKTYIRSTHIYQKKNSCAFGSGMLKLLTFDQSTEGSPEGIGGSSKNINKQKKTKTTSAAKNENVEFQILL